MVVIRTWLLMRMGSRKRPRTETIEAGGLRELLAKRLEFVNGYSDNSKYGIYCPSHNGFINVQITQQRLKFSLIDAMFYDL